MSRTRQVGLCANCDRQLSPGEKVLGLAFCSACTNPTVEEAAARPKPKPLGRLADLGLAIAIVAVVVLGVVVFGGGA
jgi:predicted amidophosphoribosyltransferase